MQMRIRRLMLIILCAFLISVSPLASESRSIPKGYEQYVGMIKSAIVDEMVVSTSLSEARQYGVASAGGVALTLNILVAPFTPMSEGFSTHVIYLVPGYGYVIRQVSVYPKERLALFWLGYSALGPGENTGFNCTHSRSNCKIEDIPFRELKKAFCSWWLTTVTAAIGDPAAQKAARVRNARRAKVMQNNNAGNS